MPLLQDRIMFFPEQNYKTVSLSVIGLVLLAKPASVIVTVKNPAWQPHAPTGKTRQRFKDPTISKFPNIYDAKILCCSSARGVELEVNKPRMSRLNE